MGQNRVQYYMHDICKTIVLVVIHLINIHMRVFTAVVIITRNSPQTENYQNSH